MDVRLPDGTVISNVPDGTTRAELMQKLAGNGYDMAKLKAPMSDQIPTDGMKAPAGSTPAVKPDPSKDSFLGRIGGTLEAPLSMATAIPAGLIGNIAGVGKSVIDGQYGTEAGVKAAQKTAADVSGAMTFKPRTDTGNELLRMLGNAVNSSGIVGVPMAEFANLARTIAPARNALTDVTKSAASQTADAAIAGKNKLVALTGVKPKQMAGVGAATTDDALMRVQNAQSLPVPINLTKGQASRTFEQQRFERETSKLPEGGPLRERFADQNQKIIQNFDAWLDSTESTAPNLRAVGQTVTKVMGEKKAEIKKVVTAAYDKARDAGHMAEPIDVGSLSSFVEKNRSAMKNAPIISAIEDEIKRLSNGGKISLNDLEEVRKMAGRLSEPGTPNGLYGQDALKIIDAATEGKGGPLYREARGMYREYANEFKNTSVINDLLRMKRGTTDRAVALEDVFQKSVLDGSLDDVMAVRRTLETAGPQGSQAWRELQGQTVKHIRDKITENVARDTRGNPIVSPDKLNKIIASMDADGKLDLVFDRKTAQQLRDLNDLAKDVYTSPPGAVNFSNTASVVLAAFDTIVSGMTALPLPIATAINYGMKKVKSNSLNKQVANALESPGKPMPSAPVNRLLDPSQSAAARMMGNSRIQAPITPVPPRQRVTN